MGDNNGYLDKNDFECLALRNTLIECRGEWDEKNYAKNKDIMTNLWNEIANLADFNKDGQVTVEEFKQAIQKNCSGKSYAEFPTAFKSFIANNFKTIDVNGDGLVGVDEYRLDCVSRAAYANIKEIYDQFISNPDETCNACFFFGPLTE